MKALKHILLLAVGALALGLNANAQSPNPPPDDSGGTLTNAPGPVAPEPSTPADPTEAPAPAEGDLAPPAPEPAAESAPVAALEYPPLPDHVLADGEKGLLMNFRGAPLEMVLNYLSEAAGFIIVPETEIRGTIDVWSRHPLTSDEALDVLNQVLSKNGYALLRNDRMLTVVRKEEARKRDIPVRTGYEPEDIPMSEQIVTQIIPVRFINAVQLTKDLQPLLPEAATMTANESGNALVITDSMINIRRMAKIVKAIDTAVSSLSAVRVFALRYADAKTVATMIKEVFESPTSGSGSGRSRQFGFRGGGPGGDRGGDSSAGSDTGRPGAGRVVATADERGNSVVVSAPDDLMPTIEELVLSVDINVEDVTELRVFRLKHSDPVEMADLLASVFPDDSASNNNSNGRSRFGGFFGGGPPDFGRSRDASNTSSQSDRLKKQSRVLAVPDQRTGSLVVTASRDLMGQIGKMIEQLDEDPARKQKVFVYELKNADVGKAEEILRNLFEGPNSRGATGSSQNQSALENRATQMQNQQNNTGTSFGGGGFGGQGR